MIDPYKQNKQQRFGLKGGSKSIGRPNSLTAAQKAKAKSDAFLRKTQFQMYKSQGLSDAEAARRVGIKIPFGRRFSIIDIMKRINEGS